MDPPPSSTRKRGARPIYDLQDLTSDWDSEEDVRKRPSKRKSHTSARSTNTKKSKKSDRPRWWTQPYLLYLILRTAERPLCRRELLPKAVALDKEISQQRGLPLLFHGKTPENTASRILTENKDKLFRTVQIPGDKRQHFKLSFEPGNFDQAVQLYNEWMDKLVQLDWPILFGPRRAWETVPMDKGIVEGGQSFVPEKRIADSTAIQRVAAGDHPENTLPLDHSLALAESDWNIPKSLDEVVQVRPSSIPGAGNGLFALRDIPQFTYLGFYFGVPMTEDDFDSLKEHVGQASQYSHRYRRTILDATDASGRPFLNHPRIFCPFHFMNEDLERANIAFVEGYVVNQVLCMSTREISLGQELFVNYGQDVDRQDWNF